VVKDVRIIGLNLVYHAFNNASFNKTPFLFIIFIYSIRIIAFQTTIHQRAITHIILVAEKYSHLSKYKILNQGNTHINQSKNVIIIIHAIQKLPNCHTNNKYIKSKLIHIAIHKSLNVSIVTSHSHHHSILYFLPSFKPI
jgi:hypothetical protein